MMRNALKLILFALVLNVASGIMQVAITDASGVQVFQQQDMGRVPVYSQNATTIVGNNFQGAVSPGASTQDSGNLVFRLLDLISLGFIKKIIAVFNQYMFGFINFLDVMFGQYMNEALHSVLFGTEIYVGQTSYIPTPGLLSTLMSIGYALAIFELWTNKTVVD